MFQDRFKSIFVEKETYLLELARYVVLNLVRARMVRKPEKWPWSSYRATTGAVDPIRGMDVDWLLSQFSKRKSTAIKYYEAFVLEGKNQPSPWESLKNQVYLGSGEFITTVRKHIPKDKDLSEISQSQKRPCAKPLKEISEQSNNRNEAIIKAFASGGYSMKEIGEYFAIHYSTVSRIVRQK